MEEARLKREDITELHLDYTDISSGQLVIVIQGLPTTAGDSVASTAVDLGNNASASGSWLSEEVRAVNDAAGYAPALITSLVLAAWRGQEARASELVAVTVEDAPIAEQRRAAALADYARAILYNGLGRYQDALSAAERACAHEDLGSFAWGLLELVEAASRSNAHEIGSVALSRLEQRARATGTDWILGVRARSAALLSRGHEAETLYDEAIAWLSSNEASVHLARAQLVYGEWLRRENRRVDARAQLRAAHDAFRSHGAAAFAERARRELLATGETARRRTDDARAELTPQEAQIARLAREGFSNPEIGAQLFISPRTVQYHLRKVFQKLGISSRNQLGRVPSGLLGTA